MSTFQSCTEQVFLSSHLSAGSLPAAPSPSLCWFAGVFLIYCMKKSHLLISLQHSWDILKRRNTIHPVFIPQSISKYLEGGDGYSFLWL